MTGRALPGGAFCLALAIPAALLAAPAAENIPEGTGNRLEIRLVHDDELSRRTRTQLLRLTETYDLEKWIVTREIVVDSSPRTIPHSHPMLTLSTRHLRDDELLLATFVHEQMHWFVSERKESLNAAMAELRELFPEVPVGPPDGAKNEESTYLHLVVCSLESTALREIIGELRARWVIEFWTYDHYRWVYRTVLKRGWELSNLRARHGLVPGRTTDKPQKSSP